MYQWCHGIAASVGNWKLQRGGDIGNWEECVGGEDEGTDIILAEMFSCNCKLYPIIISDEKYWSFPLSEACRWGEEVICLSFWMGHPWDPLQTTSEQINQPYYLWRVPGYTFYKAISEACRLIACREARGAHSYVVVRSGLGILLFCEAFWHIFLNITVISFYTDFW